MIIVTRYSDYNNQPHNLACFLIYNYYNQNGFKQGLRMCSMHKLDLTIFVWVWLAQKTNLVSFDWFFRLKNLAHKHITSHVRLAFFWFRRATLLVFSVKVIEINTLG